MTIVLVKWSATLAPQTSGQVVYTPYGIYAQGHPSVVGCIGDPWSGYRWMRIDYDTVDWYVLGIYATRWY